MLDHKRSSASRRLLRPAACCDLMLLRGKQLRDTLVGLRAGEPLAERFRKLPPDRWSITR
jgi:hypothetical protein